MEPLLSINGVITFINGLFCIHMYSEVFFAGFCKEDLGPGKATTGSCLALGHCFWKRGRFCVRPKGWKCLGFLWNSRIELHATLQKRYTIIIYDI